MRGTGRRWPVRRDSMRITPACAGNSCYFIIILEHSRDHPRVCGEQCILGPRLHRYDGSPPRVRGTVDFFLVIMRGSGITPACAGNRNYSNVSQNAL